MFTKVLRVTIKDASEEKAQRVYDEAVNYFSNFTEDIVKSIEVDDITQYVASRVSGATVYAKEVVAVETAAEQAG